MKHELTTLNTKTDCLQQPEYVEKEEKIENCHRI